MIEAYINNDVTFKPAAKVLVIDDSHLNRSFITNAFNSEIYNIKTAVDAEEGIREAIEWQPELILLDVMMPIIDGYEAANILKKNPKTTGIPIIFITALDAIQDKLKAFNAGGIDFVTKPFNHKELIARVNTNIALRRANIEKEHIFGIAMDERRNSTIARIAAGVSHNFNNMLGVSFGNIMLVESLLGEEVNQITKDSLIDVKRSLQRMQDLVQQFLILADRNSGLEEDAVSLEIINLKELANLVCNDLKNEKASYSNTIEVNVEVNIDDADQIYCDKNQAREVFNLIINEAIEATLGTVKIKLFSIVSDTPDTTTCIIKFDGMPITSEIAESIFEPFALPIANVGAGLSFSVAKHLLESNGAKVDAEYLRENEMELTLKFKNKI